MAQNTHGQSLQQVWNQMHPNNNVNPETEMVERVHQTLGSLFWVYEQTPQESRV
jgi:hypothetical protein